MKQWKIIRARLIEAIFSHRSAYNGEKIHLYLSQLEQLATKEQEGELERYRSLVKVWQETWEPAITD